VVFKSFASFVRRRRKNSGHCSLPSTKTRTAVWIRASLRRLSSALALVFQTLDLIASSHTSIRTTTGRSTTTSGEVRLLLTYCERYQSSRTTCSHTLDFLLFIPTQAPGLHAVLSYYQSAAQITPEGDVHISDEALQGLGTTLDFLKTSAFGAITSLVRPSNPSHKQLPPAQAASQAVADASQAAQLASAGFHDVEDEEVRVEDDPYIAIKPARRKLKLTDLVPDVGYFIAGGVSGITSRTVTAPLDRLKVYLIAQTTNSNEAVQAAKSGAPIKAGRQGMRTLVNACKDLWAAGGIRSLFAGE
jgi:solute carrier family 25 (mitochondrial phosphate transporter), member 23/24/25/41